jgi:multiple sugar transport system permease protein
MRAVGKATWVPRAAWYAALLALCIPFLFPFLWMVSAGFKGPGEIFAFPPQLIPDRWRWENFVEIFRYQPFARQYANSLYIAVLVTLGTLGLSMPAGYAFARLRFPGSTGIFLVLLSALMMPSEVTIIPNFFFMKTLGLIGTHVPLIILPVAGANGVVAVFLMRQFFLALPRELEDAAMIDGLGRFGVFWHVAVPLVKPAIAAVSILTFLHSWNLWCSSTISGCSRSPWP